MPPKKRISDDCGTDEDDGQPAIEEIIETLDTGLEEINSSTSEYVEPDEDEDDGLFIPENR